MPRPHEETRHHDAGAALASLAVHRDNVLLVFFQERRRVVTEGEHSLEGRGGVVVEGEASHLQACKRRVRYRVVTEGEHSLKGRRCVVVEGEASHV